METNHIKKIDDVLNYLYEKSTSDTGNQLKHRIHKIRDGLKLNQIELNISEIGSIVKKLLKEGYAYQDPIGEIEYYYISFDGKVLKELGGYHYHLRKFREVENHNKRMISLTRWIAGGTITSALYYLNELSRYYHWFWNSK